MVADLLLFLISVVLISMSVIMMPGPIFAVTVAKGQRDKNAGTLIALGHGIIEFPLMFLLYLGFAKLFTSETIRVVIGIAGGGMLILMGLQMFKGRKSMGGGSRDLPYGSVAAGLITTGSNPHFFLWWVTVGTTLILTAGTFGFIGFLLFAIVHWSCDLIWSLFVSVATFKSKHLWNERIHRIVACVCSAVLIIFGLKFIASVF
jgi:threonine/homoserine/homoserine lactone efflux protein